MMMRYEDVYLSGLVRAFYTPPTQLGSALGKKREGLSKIKHTIPGCRCRSRIMRNIDERWQWYDYLNCFVLKKKRWGLIIVYTKGLHTIVASVLEFILVMVIIAIITILHHHSYTRYNFIIIVIVIGIAVVMWIPTKK